MTKVHLALETALYYYGARYLDPKYSMWLSCDPALGEYIPQSGSDTSKLPGMGGLFNHVNHNLYHYAGNNPIKYTDPDGNALHIVAGAVTGFVSNAAINASVQIVAGLRQGQSVKESIKNIDISSVMTSGLGGAVTGAITGGASAIKTVKDAMATCKFLNGAVNVAANVAGATVNTVANNAINGETLDKDLDKNIGIAAAAGVVSGVLSPGATKVTNYTGGEAKERFVKMSKIGRDKGFMKEAKLDNPLREIIINAGEEIIENMEE